MSLNNNCIGDPPPELHLYSPTQPNGEHAYYRYARPVLLHPKAAVATRTTTPTIKKKKTDTDISRRITFTFLGFLVSSLCENLSSINRIQNT